MMRKTIVLLFVMLLAGGMGQVMADTYDINHEKVADIAGYLAMEGHSEHDLATCSTKYNYYNEIADMLNEGYEKEEILSEYKSMYGEEGFRSPDRRGFSLTAWVLPFVVLGVGSYAFFARLRNNVTAQRQKSDGGSADQEDRAEPQQRTEDDILRAIIEEEKRKHF
ncbi:cytochrome c-type biogenesis protein CcmH [Salisediminibacterium selenitireducens]|uniref:Cytochrome c-type biogenesis protein n=1 Tax=Bacillus selenitireducens (strain ATCC 700615 / DSM 15326 / MLS10) TaxID=439292 RepID=D6XSN6_BACIE|nr:cytochrome c-type biogenesis protein CcmH [Salisediminibacterium selenitireducens]ADH98822.1 hypothetical protein Bsel_1310 [[Bacillus] selenitireducens MLS10]